MKSPGDLRRFAVARDSSERTSAYVGVKCAQKKKKICKVVDFPVPANHRIKLKESEKRDKYLDLARELKNYGT